jgi:hypothetical protein
MKWGYISDGFKDVEKGTGMARSPRFYIPRYLIPASHLSAELETPP